MKRTLWITGLLFLSNAGGCSTMNNTEAGATGGAGLGALAGGLIGAAVSRNPLVGLGIGAGAGALAGGAIGAANGSAVDRAEQRQAAAVSQAQTNARYALEHPALPPEQVADMARKHIADDIIIGSIRSSGSVYQLSPEWLTWLKGQGVSDRVVLYMQSRTLAAVYPQYGQPAVVVGQPPPGYVIVGGGYYDRPYGYRYGYWR